MIDHNKCSHEYSLLIGILTVNDRNGDHKLTENRTAKMALDKTDPGYRYLNPINVQSRKVRRYLGNKAALADIFCFVVAPLAAKGSSCPYPWLLKGSEREVRRIDGLNGLAPKLLHSYAQVTHLATRIAE